MAVATINGDKTLAELAEQFSVHPPQVTEWKQQLLARGYGRVWWNQTDGDMPDLRTLHAKIGQLAMENDFLKGALIKADLLSAR